MVKYFAYGSNMDQADLDDWCKRKGRNEVNLLNINPAKLFGYDIQFNHYSRGRDGGAANIMAADNSFVQGLLVEISAYDHESIRQKEGYPDCYEQIEVEVECQDGTVVGNVITYKVVPSREKGWHQPPTPQYLKLIVDNAERHHFDSKYIEKLREIETTELPGA